MTLPPMAGRPTSAQIQVSADWEVTLVIEAQSPISTLTATNSPKLVAAHCMAQATPTYGSVALSLQRKKYRFS